MNGEAATAFLWGMARVLFQRRVGEAMAALAREGLTWD